MHCEQIESERNKKKIHQHWRIVWLARAFFFNIKKNIVEIIMLAFASKRACDTDAVARTLPLFRSIFLGAVE